MTIIESVRDFIETCPYLDNLSSVMINYLSDTPGSFSIEEEPSPIILERYLDGSSKRQFTFVFASRFIYSDEIRNNIDNSGFYEDFTDWLEECTENENLPVLDTGLTPVKIEALSSGYLFGIAENLTEARYQIQCRLTYYKE